MREDGRRNRALCLREVEARAVGSVPLLKECSHYEIRRRNFLGVLKNHD